MNHKFSGILPKSKGQPQGIAPTQCHVGAILYGCPLDFGKIPENL